MLENGFDTKTALTALYLWLLFGFLSTMVSCDLRRWMTSNPVFRHFIGIIAFFFLFTILDTSGTSSVKTTWIKTILVYGIYVLMTKSKWQFALPVLLLLIIDQTIAIHLKYIKTTSEKENKPLIEWWNSKRNVLDILLAICILVGAFHYLIRQRNEFGNSFSWSRFFFVNTCTM